MPIEPGILATFVQPENIATAPVFMLWMFPLLAAIAVIYKTTKLRAIPWNTFVRETLILFGVLSGFMILAIIALNLLVWVITR